MPFELKAAYGIILDLIYIHGTELPDDPRFIAGQLNVSVRKWKKLRDGLIEAGKIQIVSGSITNYRAVSELEILSKFQDKQAENRHRPNKNKDLEKPKINQPEPEPEPYKKEELTLFQKKENSGRKNNARNRNRDGPDFVEFWESYPRKVGKGPARKAYANAIKKVSHEKLMWALSRQRDAMIASGTKFIPHPATWLNGERWDDEINNNGDDKGNGYAKDAAIRNIARLAGLGEASSNGCH